METGETAHRRRWWNDWTGCDVSGCNGCDIPGCDGCDVPGCDCNFLMFTSLLSAMAIAAPTRPPRRSASGPGRAGMVAIRGYQRFLSPHLPTRCRQVPSCSNYGLEAVRRYGLVVGSRLTAARIRRCNPSTPRGTHDPVP
ncbi:membrane protein insertion efficiency factor YidD [Dactylosporangium sp. NPDC051485]|uniref:membrane protein insertion efficiency factor YidD n=1 Tax=Dactylosporangium sp. NPDC051485 TaxID=3154846 RepID=UPI00342234FE